MPAGRPALSLPYVGTFSSDLAPIEHAWDELEPRVLSRPHQAQNTRQLTAAPVYREEAIPADYLHVYTHSEINEITNQCLLSSELEEATFDSD